MDQNLPDGRPGIHLPDGGRYNPQNGGDGAHGARKAGAEAVLRCDDPRIPRANRGEEDTGLYVRCCDQQSI
eukprot:8934100-Heterocapsa_arctica.AAC.1